MAITHGTAIRTTIAAAVNTAVGNGGKLVIKTAGGTTTLATITLGSPGFTASGAVLTLAIGGGLSAVADATGTAAVFEVQSSASVVIFTGSVGQGGGGWDLSLDNTSIVSGQTVRVIATSTYTASV